MRLRDFWAGVITPRELMTLIRFLPGDSAFVRAAAPDEAYISEATFTAHVLMNLFDLQAAGLGSKARYPRPAEQIEAQNKQQQLIAMLEEQRLRNQAREGG